MKPTDTFRLLILTAVVLVTSLTMQAQDEVIRRRTTTTTTTRTTKRTTTTTSRQTQPIKPPKKSTATSQTFTVGGVTFKMIKVEGGTFTMGATAEQRKQASSDEKPTHRVTLSTYYIGETEVTQALWQAVVGNNPSYWKGSNLPVEEVSWEDCQSFVRELNRMTGKNFRLPTEAEWEFAARGGNKSTGCKYSGSNTLDDVGWYWKNSGDKYWSGTDSDRDFKKISNNNCRSHIVKTKKPNELGIYDMSGNVGEWCQDWFGNYSSSPQTNPTGPTSGSYRVHRGGSWVNDAGGCRVSDRAFPPPSRRDCNLGLRLAL